MTLEILCPFNPSAECTQSCDFFASNSTSQAGIRGIRGLPQKIVDSQIERALARAVNIIPKLINVDKIAAEPFTRRGFQSPVRVRQPDCFKPDTSQKAK